MLWIPRNSPDKLTERIFEIRLVFVLFNVKFEKKCKKYRVLVSTKLHNLHTPSVRHMTHGPVSTGL